MSQPMEGVPDGQALGLPVPPVTNVSRRLMGTISVSPPSRSSSSPSGVLPRKLVQANIPSPKQCNFHLVLLLTLVCRSWPGGLR